MSLFKKKNSLIWALIDNRTGNKNQVLAILSELNLPYKIFKIEYNWLANLPNFILQFLGGTVHVKNLKKYTNKRKPKLILSCGRRTFPISNKLKSEVSPIPLSVHIMYPKYSLNIKKCNLIFTPNHDKIHKRNNVVETIGSPSVKNLNKNIKKKDSPKPILSLLIGGNHGRYKLKTKTIDLIVKKILKSIKRGTLFISTSRRTPDSVIKSIDKWKEKNKLIKDVFHPKLNNKKNPLSAMLSFSDEVIITGDSVSMISEACQYKKPIRIFYGKDICSEKHILFCKQLIKEGYAFPFDTLLKKCNKIKTLNTTKLIGKKILSLI